MDHISEMMLEASPTPPYFGRVLAVARAQRILGSRRLFGEDSRLEIAHNIPSIRRRAPHVTRLTSTRRSPLSRATGASSPQPTNLIANVPEITVSGDESAVSISESVVNNLARASHDLMLAMNDLAPSTNDQGPVANDPESSLETSERVEVNGISRTTLDSEEDNKENIPIPGEPVPILPSSVIIRVSAVPIDQDVVTHMPFNQCNVVVPASQNEDIQTSMEENAVVHDQRGVQSALGITEAGSATYREASPSLHWNVPTIQSTAETPRRITGRRVTGRRARAPRRVAPRFGTPRREMPGRQSSQLNFELPENSAEVENNFLANLPEVSIFGKNGTPPRTPPHETFDEMSEQRKREFLGDIRGGEDSFSVTWDKNNEEQQTEHTKIPGVMMKMMMNYTTPPPRSLPPPMAPKKAKKREINMKKVSFVFDNETSPKPLKSKRISDKKRKSLRPQREHLQNHKSEMKSENRGLHTPSANHRLHTPPKKRGTHISPVAVNTSSMVLRSAMRPRRSNRIKKPLDRYQGEFTVRKSNKKRTPPKKKRTAVRA